MPDANAKGTAAQGKAQPYAKLPLRGGDAQKRVHLTTQFRGLSLRGSAESVPDGYFYRLYNMHAAGNGKLQGIGTRMLYEIFPPEVPSGYTMGALWFQRTAHIGGNDWLISVYAAPAIPTATLPSHLQLQFVAVRLSDGWECGCFSDVLNGALVGTTNSTTAAQSLVASDITAMRMRDVDMTYMAGCAPVPDVASGKNPTTPLNDALKTLSATLQTRTGTSDTLASADVATVTTGGCLFHFVVNGDLACWALGAPAANGQALSCVGTWEGRVWAANESGTCAYSCAGDPTDFVIADGGGTFVLNECDNPGRPTRIIGANQYLYILCTQTIHVCSNIAVPAGASPPTPVFSVTPLESAVGCTLKYSAAVYGTDIWFANESGIWSISGTEVTRRSTDVAELWDCYDWGALRSAEENATPVKSKNYAFMCASGPAAPALQAVACDIDGAACITFLIGTPQREDWSSSDISSLGIPYALGPKQETAASRPSQTAPLTSTPYYTVLCFDGANWFLACHTDGITGSAVPYAAPPTYCALQVSGATLALMTQTPATELSWSNAWLMYVPRGTSELPDYFPAGAGTSSMLTPCSDPARWIVGTRPQNMPTKDAANMLATYQTFRSSSGLAGAWQIASYGLTVPVLCKQRLRMNQWLNASITLKGGFMLAAGFGADSTASIYMGSSYSGPYVAPAGASLAIQLSSIQMLAPGMGSTPIAVTLGTGVWYEVAIQLDYAAGDSTTKPTWLYSWTVTNLSTGVVTTGPNTDTTQTPAVDGYVGYSAIGGTSTAPAVAYFAPITVFYGTPGSISAAVADTHFVPLVQYAFVTGLMGMEDPFQIKEFTRAHARVSTPWTSLSGDNAPVCTLSVVNNAGEVLPLAATAGLIGAAPQILWRGGVAALQSPASLKFSCTPIPGVPASWLPDLALLEQCPTRTLSMVGYNRQRLEFTGSGLGRADMGGSTEARAKSVRVVGAYSQGIVYEALALEYMPRTEW